MLDLHTFSIVARGTQSGEFGVAVATARPNVGSLVPWVSEHGAIATQARVNTDLGRRGLALLGQRVPVGEALSGLLDADPEREIRQAHGLDAVGGFCHTGKDCVAWCGHLEGGDFTVAGNMLAGAQVLDAMAEAFAPGADGAGGLAERLVRALEAGQGAGGDKRGKQSAALLVASPEPRLYHNLRVDDHVDPVAELRRVFEVVTSHVAQLEREYGPQTGRLFNRVKL
ncbi:MAG: DUF1028 domain-containing protein [Candidatus Rokuibacteriota bacterium]